MASIKKRKTNYSVIYYYIDENGNKKQKWESFKKHKDALIRKTEIEYLMSKEIMISPKSRNKSKSITTIEDFISSYLKEYGQNNWSVSTYAANISLINNYIVPYIGNIPINLLCREQIYEFYGNLSDSNTICRVNKFLKSIYDKAIKYGLVANNPFKSVDIAQKKVRPQKILDVDQIKILLKYLQERDFHLYMCVSIAFACSMRIGEILALTWDDVDLSPTSLDNENTHLFVNKTLTRANANLLKVLDNKDVIHIFTPKNDKNKSRIILKTAKTDASNRKIWIPMHLANDLIAFKSNFVTATSVQSDIPNLIFFREYGVPTEQKYIEEKFKEALKNCNLPKVTFHSLRHSSITYKLILLQGDIKSVQGDCGHSRSNTTMNIYAHILDERRKQNAIVFNDFFYK